MKTGESKLRAARYGANPKKIMCQCNAEEIPGDMITMQMNSRCAVCNSQHYISVPKPALQAMRQTPRQLASVVSIEPYMERRMQMARELNRHRAYGAADWVNGVLAL